jgi:hypothetical protein
MTRLIHWISDLAATREPEVHFHQGPHSEPAVCFDPHCSRPRLDIGAH